MNTTCTKEITGPNAKPKDGQLLETLSMRDYFAAAVITGIFSGKWGQVPSQKPEVAFADIAYLVADEMLKRRER